MHDTSFQEIRKVLGFTDRRRYLINGLERYLCEWDQHQVLESAIIDGSFVTDKQEPRDIDLLLVPKPTALFDDSLGELVFRLCNDRDETKEHFGCEAFLALGRDSEHYFKWYEYFTANEDGTYRGLLQVNLPL